MIISSRRFGKFMAVAVMLSVGTFATIAYASHSWSVYHWARTLNPFNLKLGDNVGTAWDSHLVAASGDWSASSELDTSVVAGASKRNCGSVNGRVEVCNKRYGNNGWLGVASIWVSDGHITQGTVKLNDTYFNTAKYNTPAWRQFVMCQEVGHTFGLDHQDEDFSNANLGTCMDYTNDPDGTLLGQLDNQHPNAHDYDQLGLIYAHLDSVTTVGQTISEPRGNGNAADEADDAGERREDGRGRHALERDLGNGEKLITFILWAE